MRGEGVLQNNMVLTSCAGGYGRNAIVSMRRAQVQSVGSYQAAMFVAPGQDGDFTVRVGTDKYENIGSHYDDGSGDPGMS